MITKAESEDDPDLLSEIRGSSGRAITPKAAAEYVGLSASTLAKMRVTGLDSPPYVQAVPNGAVRYRVCDLDDWMRQRLVRSTSDRDGGKA